MKTDAIYLQIPTNTYIIVIKGLTDYKMDIFLKTQYLFIDKY